MLKVVLSSFSELKHLIQELLNLLKSLITIAVLTCILIRKWRFDKYEYIDINELLYDIQKILSCFFGIFLFSDEQHKIIHQQNAYSEVQTSLIFGIKCRMEESTN